MTLRQYEDARQQLARNGFWGTCIDCPEINNLTFPEKCKNWNRHDHKLSKSGLIEQGEFLKIYGER